MKSEFLKRIPNVKTFVFSYEGVFTSNDCIMDHHGNISMKINAKDVRIITLALQSGYNIYFLAESEDQEHLKKLFGKDIAIIAPELWKAASIEDYLISKNNPLEEVAMMVSDFQHLDLLQADVLTCCPYDATPDVFSSVHYVSPFKGGEGCIREILEKVLKVHGDWE